jgi:uncharacterized protein YuzE
MAHRFLEVTYRKGKPLAAYLYLERKPGDTSARTQQRDGGLVIDYAADGRAIGIEITAPSKVTLLGLNEALKAAGEESVPADDLAPLLAGRAGASASS